ncbi:unnamed protein product, partial [Menidia menidia]
MIELSNQTQEDTSDLVDEILHSIFFLGWINHPKLSLNDLLDNDDEIYVHLEDRHPQPFQLYKTQLPRRSPFSCVLDMIVKLIGQENEDEIKERLQNLIDSLRENTKKKILFSSTICISHMNIPDSVRHYGVSMSLISSGSAKQILVAASCLNHWDPRVAGAVMSYYPALTRKPYFDGTITLPPDVRCEAFDLCTGIIKPACQSCGNLFGLQTEEEKEWFYGNCAEIESVSNLLRNENVPVEAVPEENRKKAADSVLKQLKCLLKNNKPPFDWDGGYYSPQGARDENN